MKNKVCRGCRKEKPRSAFYPKRGLLRRDGVQKVEALCKLCSSKRSRENYWRKKAKEIATAIQACYN